jgi:acetyl-CoA C-acetyltransferase
MRETVIVSAVRTPTGKFLGGLKDFKAPQLGSMAIKEAVARAGIDPALVDECIMGNVVSAGVGQAPARQAALGAGLHHRVAALTVNKVCGSGLKATMIAASGILAGEGDVYVAGGMESMSNAPHLLPALRSGQRYGHVQTLDSIIKDGLWCSFTDAIMGNAAEFIAEQYEITREELDHFSYESHQKAIAAIDAGRFKREIVPVQVKDGKTVKVVDSDEGPRRDTSVEALAKLRPAFKSDGRVTAGNAPGLNDGASALVVMARAKAAELGLKPLARIVGYTHAAVEPQWLFIAPARAVPKLLARTGWRLEDVDLIEINEAFAAQVLADGKDMLAAGLAWDWNKVNVNGGAVALGHPIGCSGARVIVTLMHALQDRGGKRGIATLCLGGGEAVAMAIELEN